MTFSWWARPKKRILGEEKLFAVEEVSFDAINVLSPLWPAPARWRSLLRKLWRGSAASPHPLPVERGNHAGKRAARWSRVRADAACSRRPRPQRPRRASHPGRTHMAHSILHHPRPRRPISIRAVCPNGAYPLAPGPQGPMMPPPPMYAPGPPPVGAPGGGVAPWAQPPKKRSGAKVALGCLIALVLVVAVLGGGGFLLVKALTSKSGNTSTHQGSGSNSTPGAGSTPGGSSGNTQTLDNINRQAIYAGVNITIVSAKQAASLPEHQESDPKLNALEVQVKASNQTPESVYPTFMALTPDGTTYELSHFFPGGLQCLVGFELGGKRRLVFRCAQQAARLATSRCKLGAPRRR